MMATGLDALDFSNKPIHAGMSPEERIQVLKDYYSKHLADDALDGSDVDCAVLEALNRLENTFPKKK